MRRPTALPAAAAAGLLAALALSAPPSAPGQEAEPDTAFPDPGTPEGENLAVPEGWKYRLDRPSEETDLVAAEGPEGGDIRFVNMTPGWHVTTGPRVILWHPASRAEGDFRASMTTHLFDPGRRNEAYGLFVGGRGLEGPDQQYLYFLVRRSGEYLVKVRDGGETGVVVDWTPHEAVVAWDERDGESATNTLSVEARGDSVRFSVNGAEVAARARADLPVPVDGTVGWRINHRLDLHVSDFSVREPGG